MTTAQAVVDSHIHFWDTDRFDYPWLQGFTELNRPFVPADLDVGDVLIEGLIFVQANPVWEAVDEETAWVQDLRGRDARIQGLVAGVPLDRGAAAVNASLQRLSHEPGVAGEGTRGTNKIRRYLRAAVDAFGPDRCMLGSDWPNASLHISYAGWVSLVLDSVSDLGARERDRVMRAQLWRSTHGPGSPDDDQPDRQPAAARA